MTVVDLYRAPAAAPTNGDKIVNDFSFVIATVNGTGSQTSNATLLRALFRMGVPITGKNLFPSNIYGLPTWYYIRASKDGYIAHRPKAEVLVAYNFDTFARDVAQLPSGGVLIYPMDNPESNKKKWDVITTSRDDIYIYRIPLDQLVSEANPPQSLREYISNMVYVGALAYLFNIDMQQIEAAISYHFSGKAKPIAMNMGVVQAAYDWAAQNLQKMDPYWCESMENTYSDGSFLIEGNAAAALGATFGGVQFVAWYPITPSSSIADGLSEYLSSYRTNEDGTRNYAIVQAEDELAAIGMIIGAGWAGARSMTATSGPGISLMAEFAGLAYYAEIPIVVWDVQRVGPSTGLPTRTAQSDLLFTYLLGHGDTKQVVLLPANMQECFKFGWQALDYAEQFQTPVFVLSDLDLGMNIHVADKFEYPDKPLQRGKLLTSEDLINLSGRWGRYEDKDGDGIPYRTIPGTDHPQAGYFTRGTGHDAYANYSEDSAIWQENMDRLSRKFETIKRQLPAPVVHKGKDAKVAIVSYGSNDGGIQEARDILAKQGVETDYLRILALPLSPDVEAFISNYDKIYVVENNHDGQMNAIMRMDYPQQAPKLWSVARNNGLPLDAEWISKTILQMEGK